MHFLKILVKNGNSRAFSPTEASNSGKSGRFGLIMGFKGVLGLFLPNRSELIGPEQFFQNCSKRAKMHFWGRARSCVRRFAGASVLFTSARSRSFRSILPKQGQSRRRSCLAERVSLVATKMFCARTFALLRCTFAGAIDHFAHFRGDPILPTFGRFGQFRSLFYFARLLWP